MSIFTRITPPMILIERAWHGTYPVRGSASEVDCLIGFGFGYRGKGSHTNPGLSNQDLANAALSYQPRVRKILRHEIADAYADAGGTDVDKLLRIERHRRRRRHLDTREVAEQAKEIMDNHQWKTALILAHPNHMPRVQAVCTKLGIDWVTEGEEREPIEFDPLSSESWARDVDNVRGYEILALMYYRLLGWV